MKTMSLKIASATLLLLLTISVQPAFAQFEELVKRVPETANVLVMVDASELYKSDVASKQGWSKDRYRRFATGLTAIPPDASKLILAAQIDWEFMQANWEAELVEFNSSPDLNLMAKQYEGSLDKISGMDSLALPDDTYFVQFSKDFFGVMAPANRQVVSRWVRQDDATLSPYLQAGVAFEDKAADIIFAFDLTDAMSESAIKQRLEKSDFPLIQRSTRDKGEMAKLLASIRGVMLGINFGTKVNGAIRVDFGEDASMLENIGKPLLLHVLGHQGIMIDELEEWDASVEGNTLSLKGSLSHSGLMRLASLVEPPTPVIHSQTPLASKEEPKDQTQTMAESSKEFYDSVNELYSDLKRKKRSAKTYPQIGYFYGKYAAKIAELPIANVDPVMLDYGQFVSMQLQGASDAIKDVGIRKKPLEDEAADKVDGKVEYHGSTARYGAYDGYGNGYGYNPGYSYGSGYGHGNTRYRRYGSPYGRYSYYDGYSWNGVYYDAKLEERRREHEKIKVRREERSKGNQEVAQILSDIESEKLAIRRAMVEKYKTEF